MHIIFINEICLLFQIEGKLSVKSRPDSGIAVSMSSGSYSSYSSSEVAKETDDIDEACITDSSEMRERVDKVRMEIVKWLWPYYFKYHGKCEVVHLYVIAIEYPYYCFYIHLFLFILIFYVNNNCCSISEISFTY